MLVNPGLKQRWHILNPPKIGQNVTKRYSRFLAGLSLCRAPATEFLQNPGFWCFWEPTGLFLAFSASSWLWILYTAQVCLSQGLRFLEWLSGFTANMWYLWVNTATQALHTTNEHPVASTELWKQTSHISLEVVFECVYLQLTVNGSTFMSRIVCC